MKKNELQEQVALFRYGIIADFVNLPLGTKSIYALIKKKAEQNYSIPGSKRSKVAEETIRSWLKKYRAGGFEALLPKERADKGKARRLPLEVADVLLAFKEEEPELTVPLVIKKAMSSGKVPDDIRLPESTVYKLLVRNGLNKKKTSADKDHRRFSYHYADNQIKAPRHPVLNMGSDQKKMFNYHMLHQYTGCFEALKQPFYHQKAYSKLFKIEINGIMTR